MSTSIVVRCVRTLSEIHRTSIALWRRDITFHQFLETKVFSPETFPSILAVGISLSFLDFCAVLGWKYLQSGGGRAVASTTRSTVSRRLTTVGTATTRPKASARHPAYQFMGE
ncbi:hypothetical protein IV203_035561 [Nitzschia inconspicua]|uniref:Uncharacterized protein n=1 Tax=Nitzschia inconspicua TaxID=303405 RepID=A0A9K3PUS8_9STRA|nr:hypothetical protein IV203_035561 [Nitzschia inconspicua]